MVKMSDKLGKRVPVVPGNNPAAYDERQTDIHAPTPNFNGGPKPKGGMNIKIEKIKIEDGFAHQYRNVNGSINAPSQNAFKAQEE